MSEISAGKEIFEQEFYLAQSLLEYGKAYSKAYQAKLFAELSFFSLTLYEWPPESHAKKYNYSGEIIFKKNDKVITITATLLKNGVTIHRLIDSITL
jgi:hypothetical protein